MGVRELGLETMHLEIEVEALDVEGAGLAAGEGGALGDSLTV